MDLVDRGGGGGYTEPTSSTSYRIVSASSKWTCSASSLATSLTNILRQSSVSSVTGSVNDAERPQERFLGYLGKATVRDPRQQA